ncbi:hypothetical protein MMC11_008109 [Xylographa trunciseda]|nr:hypothetical protein [Xylographa trunciseda]
MLSLEQAREFIRLNKDRNQEGPWSPLDWGIRYAYFTQKPLINAESRERFVNLLGPGASIEAYEMDGKSGYKILTCRQLSRNEINSLLRDVRSGVSVPSPKPHAVVGSISSGARRRNRKLPSASTSSSGGVLLPHGSPELPVVELWGGDIHLDVIEDLQLLNPTIYDGAQLPSISRSQNQNQNQDQVIVDLSRLEEEYLAAEAPSVKIPHTSNLTEACGWYIQNGGALLVFAASLSTALLLMLVGQIGIGPAFTAAGWVLAGGSLLTITLKTCISERPTKSRRDEDVRLSRLTHEGR